MSRLGGPFRLGAALVACVLMVPFSAPRAETLREAVERILERHDRIQAAESDMSASDERVKERFLTSYLPNVSVTANYGHNRRMNKASGADTDMEPREVDVRMTQLLWDFGKSGANVDVARKQREQMRSAVETARQTLIMDAATAYYQLRKANNIIKFAKQSVGNIQRQGEVEDARVSLGRGYSTDVLQVKAQLSGAKAREVQGQGAVAQAEERVRTIYLREAPEVLKLTPPDESFLSALPKNMGDAVVAGVKNNPQLNQLLKLTDMLEAQKKSVARNNFMPTIQGVVERKFKDKVDGVDEFEMETLGKVELTYTLGLALPGVHGIRAATQDLEAAKNRYDDTRRTIEEQARVAWHNFNTAKANAELLNNQANLAEKFLELAREERKMDKRTLLDILSGETALINARSDAAAADHDVIIAAFTLLQTMGALEPGLLDSKHAKAKPAASGKTELPRDKVPGNGPAVK
ncbi:MAG: TolC family protein [Magnetococcales bacterium]|nr:TolC family protein [Magnetococcales bacterium]